MNRIRTELDPGLVVAANAREQGLVVAHAVQYDRTNLEQIPDSITVLKSRVICAPAEGRSEFRPDVLRGILASVLPAGDEFEQTKHVYSQFEERGVLALPRQNVRRRVGTCAVTTEMQVAGVEPKTKEYTYDLYAETTVLVSPSEDYIENLHMSGVAYRSFLSGDDRRAFRKAARGELSLWGRIT